MQSEGYGYEWDAELVCGPFDGFIDIVIQLKGEEPPPFIKYPPNKKMVKSKLGEKFFEEFQNLPSNSKVVIYKLRGTPSEDDDICYYDYMESTTHSEFLRKYSGD